MYLVPQVKTLSTTLYTTVGSPKSLYSVKSTDLKILALVDYFVPLLLTTTYWFFYLINSLGFPTEVYEVYTTHY